MIAVLANETDHPIVREFFELFKTPWEFYRSGGDYDVLICCAVEMPERPTAKLVLVFGGERVPGDPEGMQASSGSSNRVLEFCGDRIPIYGKSRTFVNSTVGWLIDETSRQPAALESISAEHSLMRIGYDL